jgi:hypothetical protein
MEGSKDAAFGLNLGPLYLLRKFFTDLFEIRNTLALLNVEHKATALFEEAQNRSPLIVRAVCPRDDIREALRIARFRRWREEFYERGPTLSLELLLQEGPRWRWAIAIEDAVWSTPFR